MYMKNTKLFSKFVYFAAFVSGSEDATVASSTLVSKSVAAVSALIAVVKVVSTLRLRQVFANFLAESQFVPVKEVALVP